MEALISFIRYTKAASLSILNYKGVLTSLLRVVQDLWHVFKHTLFFFFILILGLVAFTVPDQAKDIFLKFNNDTILSIAFWSGLKADYFTRFLLAVWLWAIIIWYCARLYLHLVQVEAYNSELVKTLIIWLPRILGSFPFFIAFRAITIFNSDGSISALILLLSSVIFLFITSIRRRILKHHSPIVIENVNWRQLHKPTRRGVYIILVINILIIFYFSFLSRSSGLAEKLGPASVVTLGLAVWTFLGTVFMYIGYRLKLPILLFLVLLFYLSSFFNNNHEVRYSIKNNQQSIKSHILPDREYLEQWLSARRSEIEQSDGYYNVYIVAGEGGGIRAAFWTGSVLSQIIQQDESFYDHTFAISTVSGSSVGAAFALSLYKDFVLNKDISRTIAADSILPKIKRMLGTEDHLSGVTSALFFPDLIQRFIPVKINKWDRARWLEDSWSLAYQKHTAERDKYDGYKTLDNSLLALYKEVPPYKMPCLFFNSTVAETGQKAIISNLRLSNGSTPSSTTYFYDVVDFHQLTNGIMPLKTAASVSSRFPVITPPATVLNEKGEPGAHFVDGGYFENTGLSTAMEILYMVNDVIDVRKENVNIGGFKVQKKVRPVIIYIKNGDYETGKIILENVDDKKDLAVAKPIGNMYETRTPIAAFLGTWGRGGLNTSNNVSRITNRLIPKVDMVTIELKRKEHVPLGWYLSKEAYNYMNKQVDSLEFYNYINKF